MKLREELNISLEEQKIITQKFHNKFIEMINKNGYEMVSEKIQEVLNMDHTYIGKCDLTYKQIFIGNDIRIMLNTHRKDGEELV